MYKATTHGITVTAIPVYIDERSQPANDQHFWAYRINIKNYSDKSVTLISRYWHITDATGHWEEVRGEGVVGEQPEIPPGHEYTYTSGCPLQASSGMMMGNYQMKCENGEMLEIEIPAFPLDLPDHDPVVN